MQRISYHLFYDTLLKKFLGYVENTPDKIAVVNQDEKSLTYKVLNDKANQLAHAIQYASPLRIGIICESKFSTLNAILAVLKLGAAFVILDHHHSNEHLQNIVNQAVDFIIYDRPENLNRINMASLPHFSLNDITLQNFPQHEVQIDKAYNGRDCAYILYTSGSTAAPKGVMQSRDGLCGQVENYTHDLNITHEDHILNLATFAHDQGILDCFTSLIKGSTLYLFDNYRLETYDLHQFIRKHAITVMSGLPSQLKVIFESAITRFRIMAKNDIFSSLRNLTAGGEEVQVSHVKLFREACPDHCQISIGYGQTEHSWTTCFIITKETDLNHLNALPLGYASLSLDVLLVEIENSNMHELCISSDYLSPGYWNNGEATQKAFFVNANGKRYYRTGDIVTKDEKGCLHFKGRMTWHEKINGKLINLHEIELALKNSLGNDCTVLVHGQEEKKKICVLYSGQPHNLDTLKNKLSALKEILPNHMLPNAHHFIHFGEFPLLANGKINRQELASRLDSLYVNKPSLDVTLLSTNFSDALESIWKNIFPHFDYLTCGNESFEELGGNSILALQLINTLLRYFKQVHQFDFYISPQVLYDKKYNNLSTFNNYVKVIYKEKIIRHFPYICNLPKVWEMSDPLPKYSTFPAPESSTVVLYDYAGLAILADHFNRVYQSNICLRPTMIQTFQVIKDAIEAHKEKTQIGLIIFQNNNQEGHTIPAILCIDPNRETNPYSLLISEGFHPNKFIDHFRDGGFIQQMQEEFPHVSLFIEAGQRQSDYHSCSTDALLYLIEASQLDMINEIKLTKTNLIEYCMTPELRRIKDINLLSRIKNVYLFEGPAETYKYAMTYINDYVDQDKILKNDLQQRSLQQWLKEYCRWDKDDNFFNPLMWNKGYEFKEIIEQKLRKDIYPYVHQFTVFKNKEKYGYTFYVHEDMFANASLSDFIKIVARLIEKPGHDFALIANEKFVLTLEDLNQPKREDVLREMKMTVSSDLTLKNSLENGISIEQLCGLMNDFRQKQQNKNLPFFSTQDTSLITHINKLYRLNVSDDRDRLSYLANYYFDPSNHGDVGYLFLKKEWGALFNTLGAVNRQALDEYNYRINFK